MQVFTLRYLYMLAKGDVKHRRILLLLLEYVVCLLCATGIKTFTEIQLIHLHESEIFGEHEIVMSLMREFLYLQQSLEDL